MPVVSIQSGGDDVSAIVVDPGFESMRVGNCQEDFPREYIPSLVYRDFDQPASSRESWNILSPVKVRPFAEMRRLLHVNRDNNLDLDPFVFERLLRFAIEGHDLFLDIEDNGKSVNKIGGLGLDPSIHPILVVEPTAESKQFRDSSLEVIFEQIGACASYLAKRAALTAFSVGRSSALIVDVGAGGCTVSPVHEGISLQSTIQDSLIGGNTLDLQLANYLFNDNHNMFEPSSDPYKEYLRLQMAKELREKFCFYDNVTEDTNAADSAGNSQPNQENSVNSGKSSVNHVQHSQKESQKDPKKFRDKNMTYNLPDGTVVNMEKYVNSIPELLFNPSGSTISEFNNFKGIVTMINDCIFESDVDIRRELLSSIVIAGGYTLTHGIIPRLNGDLLKSPIGSIAKFKLVHSSSYLEKRFSTWLGGSILASLGRFQQLWISKSEYQEHGTIIAYRRCH
uniref:Actin-related protein, putative n=1 Tax=Theileria annulata TaxID=5874 RepID=A0A3B0MP46_THEAN